MRPVVIAHRGASGYLPEHTRAAKVLAHSMGADFLEQDVVATRDDQLVVLHDVYLDTVTDVAVRFPDRQRENGRYYVRDFDLEEIRTLIAWERMNLDGTAVYPDRFPARTGVNRVHTFAEEMQLLNVLNDATGRQVGIYTEIKRPAWHKEQGIDIAPLVLQQIPEFDGADNRELVFVQCFDAVELRRLREELACPWKLVQLLGENSWHEAASDFDDLRSAAGLEQLSGVADAIGSWMPQLYRFDDAELQSTGLVQQAHQFGMSVHAYTFRQDDIPPGFATFAALVRYAAIDLGVDGLFTDFPDKVVDILQDIGS